MKLSYLIVSALALSILAPMAAVSQYSPAMIIGVIHAEDGDSIPGVKIDLTQDGGDAQTVSDSEGSFVFYFAFPGPLEIRFKHDSINSNGTHKTIIYPGQILSLNVILLQRPAANNGKSSWEIRESSGEPGAWGTERVITEEWMDSLPNAQHLWAFLNHTEASVVADRYDISGMHGNRQLLLGVRGSSYTQNQSDINGIDITSPAGDGMLAFPDISTMKAVIYTVGDPAAQPMGAGAHLSLISKTGGREIHGQSHIFLQSGALQNAKANERLQFFGITDSDERWRHLVHANFQLGGPLGRTPWTYFGAFSLRDQEKRVREHPLPVSGSVLQETFHLSGDLSGRDRLSLYWAGQQLSEPQANASPQITREASLDQDRRYQTLLAVWNRRLSSRSLIDARFGIVSGEVQSRPQPGIDRQNREELFPGYALFGVPDHPSAREMVNMLYNTTSGAPPLLTDSDAIALEGKAGFSTIRSGFKNSSHRILAGASFRRSSITQNHAAIDNVNLLFFENIPESVRLLNTPVRTRDRIHHLEFHAADTVSSSRLSMSLGAYASFSNGANILNSGASANSLSWNNLSGRIGFAYSLWSKHRLVVRAALARTYNQPSARTWSAVNPDGLGFERHSWIDANGNLQYEPAEDRSILKVYGSPYTRLDPDLKNPQMNEINLGVRAEITDGITFEAFGFRRTEDNLISLVNEGVPFSSYAPVLVWDPGADGHLNDGGDDTLVTAYNQDPATLGKDRFVLTNPAGHTAYSEGIELKLGLAFGNLRAGVSAMQYRAVAATAPGMLAVENDTSALLGIFDDPNKAILARGSTYFDRGTTGRIWATHNPIRDIRLSLIMSYLDGLPYSRYLPIKGFHQGVFGILTRQRGPGDAGSFGGFRTVHYRNIDIRMMKEFPWGPGRLSAVVDVFNIENRGQALLQTEVTAPTHLWRVPLRFQTPRSIQMGLTYRW